MFFWRAQLLWWTSIGLEHVSKTNSYESWVCVLWLWCKELKSSYSGKTFSNWQEFRNTDSHPKNWEPWDGWRGTQANSVWKTEEQQTLSGVWRTQKQNLDVEQSRGKLRALVWLKRAAASPAVVSSGWRNHCKMGQLVNYSFPKSGISNIISYPRYIQGDFLLVPP